MLIKTHVGKNNQYCKITELLTCKMKAMNACFLKDSHITSGSTCFRLCKLGLDNLQGRFPSLFDAEA